MISECGNLVVTAECSDFQDAGGVSALLVTDYEDFLGQPPSAMFATDVRASVAYKPTTRYHLRDPFFPDDPDLLFMSYEVIGGWIMSGHDESVPLTADKTVMAAMQISLDAVIDHAVMTGGPAFEDLKLDGLCTLVLDRESVAADYRFYVDCNDCHIWAENGYCGITFSVYGLRSVIVECKFKPGKTWDDAKLELAAPGFLMSSSTVRLMANFRNMKAGYQLIGKAYYDPSLE